MKPLIESTAAVTKPFLQGKQGNAPGESLKAGLKAEGAVTSLVWMLVGRGIIESKNDRLSLRALESGSNAMGRGKATRGGNGRFRAEI